MHQYVLLFLIVAIEEAGVPLPAPSDLVIAYYGDRARDDLGALASVVLICAAASATGTLVPYLVTRRWGAPVAKRLAGWIDVDTRQVDVWSERIARRGFVAVFLGRLIPGLRVAMSLIAGTARVRPLSFSAGVFLAATIYWSGWVAVGVLLGPTFRQVVGPAYIRYVVIALPVVFVGFLVSRHVLARRRRQTT